MCCMKEFIDKGENYREQRTSNCWNVLKAGKWVLMASRQAAAIWMRCDCDHGQARRGSRGLLDLLKTIMSVILSPQSSVCCAFYLVQITSSLLDIIC